MKSGKVGIL